MDNSQYFVEKERKTPITEKKDVIVVGGGLTGVVAAVAAARNGKSVLLIESKSCFDGIPYRAMLPQGVDNLIIAGRSISATHEAMGSIRNMAQCMAMGQAAGVAASLVTLEDSNFSKVDIVELQRILREQKACL